MESLCSTLADTVFLRFTDGMKEPIQKKSVGYLAWRPLVGGVVTIDAAYKCVCGKMFGRRSVALPNAILLSNADC